MRPTFLLHLVLLAVFPAACATVVDPIGAGPAFDGDAARGTPRRPTKVPRRVRRA